jgi:predicted Zn-dependent protease
MAKGAVSADPFYGESLFGRLNCHWASLRSWVKDDWKLIVGSRPELYNLAEDPEESHDRAAEEPARVDRMTQELRRAMQQMAPQGDKAQPNAATPEQEQRLRSLGYTAGSAGRKPLDDPRLPDPRTHVKLYDRLQVATAAQGPALARAFEDVQEITRIDPDNPFAFGTLASMAYRFGSLPMAQRAFERTLELDPDRPGIRQNYGKLLRELGRLDESERELRISLAQTTEDDSRTRVNLSETLVALKKTSEAETLLSGVLAREPKNPEALGAKGRLLLAQNRISEALASLQQATAGSDPEPFIELAAAYLRANRVADARNAAMEALRRNAAHPWAIAVFAHALILDGQRPQGLEYLHRAVAIRPRRPAVWEALAEGFDAAGQSTDAAHCRKEAKALTNGS